MDEIDFGGKTYISSKRAAKMAGYTNDYVGQLCREGRVNCRRIGRDWYVREESILEHKSKKNKNEKEKAKDKTSSGKTSNEKSVSNKLGQLYYKKESGSNIPDLKKKNPLNKGENKNTSSPDGKIPIRINRDNGKRDTASEDKIRSSRSKVNKSGNVRATGSKKGESDRSGMKTIIVMFFVLLLVFLVFVLGGGIFKSELNYDESGGFMKKISI